MQEFLSVCYDYLGTLLLLTFCLVCIIEAIGKAVHKDKNEP